MGVTTLSIPIPVMAAVTSPKTSGLCLIKNELQQLNVKAIITQLPTVSPTLIDSPSKTASKGEVPKSDCIVNEIPRVSNKFLNT